MRSPLAFVLACSLGCSSASPSSPAGDGGADGPPLGGGPDGGDAAASVSAVDLPDHAGSVRFDDLWYSARLGRVVSAVPGSGDVDLVDPDTLALTPIKGMAPAVESAVEGRGLVFAADRGANAIQVIDPAQGKIVATAPLATSPDYVRWSEATSEVWVSEPDAQQIEILSLAPGSTTPTHAALIPTPGGPEGLTLDDARGRAYAHLYTGQLAVIDVAQRKMITQWPMGCTGAHGIPALDAQQGIVFAGCRAAQIVAFDVSDGHVIGRYSIEGAGASILGFSAKTGHAYLRGDPGTAVAVLASSATALTLLGTLTATEAGHCMTTDDRGHVWVCDATNGRLLRFVDAWP